MPLKGNPQPYTQTASLNPNLSPSLCKQHCKIEMKLFCDKRNLHEQEAA